MQQWTINFILNGCEGKLIIPYIYWKTSMDIGYNKALLLLKTIVMRQLGSIWYFFFRKSSSKEWSVVFTNYQDSVCWSFTREDNTSFIFGRCSGSGRVQHNDNLMSSGNTSSWSTSQVNKGSTILASCFIPFLRAFVTTSRKVIGKPSSF